MSRVMWASKQTLILMLVCWISGIILGGSLVYSLCML